MTKVFATLPYLSHYQHICHITKIFVTLQKYVSHYNHKYLSHYKNVCHITKIFVTLTNIFVTSPKYLSHDQNICLIT